MRWWCRRLAGERGSAPLELALGVGVLVLPVAMLVAVLPGWAERQSMARMAVREAARAAAFADDAAAGERAGAALVRQIAANHGVPADELREVRVAVPRDEHGRPHRDGMVEASAQVRIPLTVIPLIAPAGGVWWTARHVEPLDLYRSLPAP